MDVFGILLGVAVVQFLAAASPGPNFIIVTSYSIGESPRRALLVVCGILTATLTWAVLAACGLGVILMRFPAIYSALQLASAAYLIWLGAKMLIGVLRGADGPLKAPPRSGSPWEAVRAGFITNMTNPKTIAYYSSLFVVMIPADPPPSLFVAAVATAFIVSAAWWISVALFFGLTPIRRGYDRARRSIDAMLGALLIGIGVRLAAGGR
ncbi:MAG TPA: LysE family translocator [Alphaproteobacteria bacterium]|nr:LysE family translocator [Alphaproteobacteria bacterium]